MNILVIFIIKVLDNLLATSKTILVQKNKSILAAISVVISQFIFFRIISQVITGNSNMTIYVVSIASGFGTFLAIHISERFSKDRTFTHTLMSDDIDSIFNSRDYFMNKKIDNLIVPTIARNGETTYALLVFAHTKQDSKEVEKVVQMKENNIKRIIQHG